MFILQGQVVGRIEKEYKSGEKKGQKYPVYQVMFGSENFKKVEFVKDFQNLGLQSGDEFKFPVSIKPFSFKNGGAGLDIVTMRLN